MVQYPFFLRVGRIAKFKAQHIANPTVSLNEDSPSDRRYSFEEISPSKEMLAEDEEEEQSDYIESVITEEPPFAFLPKLSSLATSPLKKNTIDECIADVDNEIVGM